jgi:pregnancy-associated plasma protein-A
MMASQYGTFADKARKQGYLDGIVIRHEVMSGTDGTLIHEVGHWMGLRHTFGMVVNKAADDCRTGDGLLDTTLTRGLHVNGGVSPVFACSQIPCGATKPKEIYNWMSVRPLTRRKIGHC